MSRKAYIISFIVFAFTFVPVFFCYSPAPVSFVGPCCYVAFVTTSNYIHELSQGQWEGLAFAAINYLYVAFYVGIFYLSARLTYHTSEGFEKPAGKYSFQFLFLLILFSCSFLRVIQGSSFVNWTGAYDFWSACARFWETF
jgi:hypothetical protein